MKRKNRLKCVNVMCILHSRERDKIKVLFLLKFMIIYNYYNEYSNIVFISNKKIRREGRKGIKLKY